MRKWNVGRWWIEKEGYHILTEYLEMFDCKKRKEKKDNFPLIFLPSKYWQIRRKREKVGNFKWKNSMNSIRIRGLLVFQLKELYVPSPKKIKVIVLLHPFLPLFLSLKTWIMLVLIRLPLTPPFSKTEVPKYDTSLSN